MAAALASPVYELRGARGLGTRDHLTDPLPPVGQLIGGELAWRQHQGGHTVTPNWPSFFRWVDGYIKAPPVPSSKDKSSVAVRSRPAADVPVPRTDENSKTAHQELLQKARYGATKGRVDIYFVGDSITRRWGCTDPQYMDLLDSWNDNFFGWNAANFAWGGDTTSNILWRLENGELEGLSPKIFRHSGGHEQSGPSSQRRRRRRYRRWDQGNCRDMPTQSARCQDCPHCDLSSQRQPSRAASDPQDQRNDLKVRRRRPDPLPKRQ